MSHPMRVRGLKLKSHIISMVHKYVAPHAGAWIETNKVVYKIILLLSHPMRVRGLKLL